jgi:hypothetical protein
MSLLDPLPDKPKGMRRRAHCRLLQEAHRAEMIHDAAMDAQMDRITRDFTFFGKITSRIITRQEVA